MNIVVDTNVIISAIFFGGLPRKFIEYFFKGDFAVFASPTIIREYIKTYREIYRKYESKGNPAVLHQIIAKMNIVLPQYEISICRDHDDDKFISCALQAGCLYIVSGDKDLLSFKKVENVEMVTIAEFLKKLNR